MTGESLYIQMTRLKSAAEQVVSATIWQQLETILRTRTSRQVQSTKQECKMTKDFQPVGRFGNPEICCSGQLFSDDTFSSQSSYEFETSFAERRTAQQNGGTAVGIDASSLLNDGLTIFGPVEFFDSRNGKEQHVGAPNSDPAELRQMPVLQRTEPRPLMLPHQSKALLASPAIENLDARAVAESGIIILDRLGGTEGAMSEKNNDKNQQTLSTTNGAKEVLVRGVTSESNAPQQGGDGGSTVGESAYAKQQGIESPTVEPYSEEKARELIKQFADNEYAVRQHAMETIIRMGPAALPLLRETSQTKQELEVKLRVKTAIESIEQEQYNHILDIYKKQFETMDGLFLAAGLNFNEDHVTIDPKGRLIKSILIDPPPKTLSKTDRALFEKMIHSGDELRKDEKFEEFKESILDSEEYNKVMVVGLSTRAREVYARALSGTGDPDDVCKALTLLQEQMKLSKDFEPGDAFLDTAYRLGGSENKEFLKAFSDAGFDPEKIRPYGLGRLWFF